MDPASIQRDRLCQWSREFEFTLSDGTVPDQSYFACATNTPHRRKLWSLLMEKVEDRRNVKKVRHSLSIAETDYLLPKTVWLKNKLKDKKNTLRRDILHEENCIDNCFTKINEKACKLRQIEAKTKEEKIKLMLFDELQTNQKSLLERYRILNETLLKLNEPPAVNGTSSKVKGFLQDLEVEVGKRWCDPMLLESVVKRICDQGGWLSCSLLQTALLENSAIWSDRHRSSIESVKLAFSNFKETAPPAGEHWAIRLAQEKSPNILIETLIHWFQGQVLSRECARIAETEESNDTSTSPELIAALELASSLISKPANISDVHENDSLETELKNLRIKVADRRKRYEVLRRKIMDIRQCIDSCREHMSSYQRYVDDKRTSIPIYIRTNIARWRETSKLRSLLSQKHSKLLWQTSLSSRKYDGERDELQSSNSSFWIKLQKLLLEREHAISLQRNVIHNDCGNFSPMADNNEDWERRVSKILIRAAEKLAKLNPALQSCGRSIRLMDEQPFGKMIPSTETIQNLTFSDFYIQFRVNKALQSKLGNSYLQ